MQIYHLDRKIFSEGHISINDKRKYHDLLRIQLSTIAKDGNKNNQFDFYVHFCTLEKFLLQLI
jgi:hypothetical protein